MAKAHVLGELLSIIETVRLAHRNTFRTNMGQEKKHSAVLSRKSTPSGLTMAAGGGNAFAVAYQKCSLKLPFGTSPPPGYSIFKKLQKARSWLHRGRFLQRRTSNNNRMYFGESTNFAQVAPLYPHKVSEMFSASVLFEFLMLSRLTMLYYVRHFSRGFHESYRVSIKK